MAEVHRVHSVAIIAHTVHVVVHIDVHVVVHVVDAQVHVISKTWRIGHLIAEEGVLRVGVEASIAIIGSANAVVIVHEMMGEGVGCLELLWRLQSHRLTYQHLRVVLAGLDSE